MRSRTYRSAGIIALFSLLLAAGCGDQDFTVSLDQPLRIVATEPGAGVDAVRRDTRISVRFSEDILPASVGTDSFYLELLADPPAEEIDVDPYSLTTISRVSGTISYDALSRTATLVPNEILEYSTWYRAVVTTDVVRKRLPEATLPIDHRWAFRTTDPGPLSLLASVPTAGATGVSTIGVDGGAEIVVLLFNDPILPASAEGSIRARHFDGSSIPGTVSVEESMVTFQPTEAWDYSTRYEIEIGGGMRSTSGGTLSGDLTFHFETLHPPPLMLINAVPSGGTAGVDRTQPIELTFSEGVDQSAMNEALIVRDTTTGEIVEGTLSFEPIGPDEPGDPDSAGEEVKVTFTPDPPDGGDAYPLFLWPYSQALTVEIGPEARSLRATDGSGNPEGLVGGWMAPFSLHFRIEDPPPLTIVDRAPSVGATGVSRTRPIALVFSEGVAQESVILFDGTNEAEATLFVTIDGAPVEAELSWNAEDPPGNAEGIGDDDTLTIIATEPWQYLAEVSVVMSPAIRSDRATEIAGTRNGHLDDRSLEWVFTIEGSTEFIAVFTSPSPSEARVGPDTSVLVQFNKVVDQSSVTQASFQVYDLTSGGDVAGSFRFDGGDHSVIFDPDSQFELGHRIRVTLTMGICSVDGVGADACLGSEISYHFDVVDVAPLQVLSTIPLDGAASVPVGTPLEILFSQDIVESSVDPDTNPGVLLVEDVSNINLPREIEASLVQVDHTTNTVTWELIDPLAGANGMLRGNTPYRVRVRGEAEGVVATSGSVLLGDYVFAFSTAATDLIVGTRPHDSASGLDAGVEICAIFATTVDPASIHSGSFRVSFDDYFGRSVHLPVLEYRFFVTDPQTLARTDEDPAFGGDDNEICFVPDPDRFNCFSTARSLLYQTTYSALLTTEVQTQTEALDSAYSWSFSTGLPPEIEVAWAQNDVVLVDELTLAEDVPVNSSFFLRFANVLDEASVQDGAIGLIDAGSGSAVLADIMVEADGRTVVLSPADDLAFESDYELFVSSGVDGPIDSAGNYLESSARWRLTTSPPTEVRAIFPGGSLVSMNTLVVAELSRPIHPPSLSPATFHLRNVNDDSLVAGLTTVRGDGRVVLFVPSVTLESMTDYEAVVATSLRDHRGNPLPASVVQAFGTTNATDLTSPTLIGNQPTNGGVLGAGHGAIRLDFSEPMNLASLVATEDENESTILLERLDSPFGDPVEMIPARFEADPLLSTRVWMHPDRFLRHEGGATYRILLSREVSDLARNPLLPAWTTFTVEDQPPSVTSISPADGAIGLPGEVVITVEFDEGIDPSSVNAASLTLFDVEDDALVSGEITVHADSLGVTFVPHAPLIAGRLYVVTASPSGAPITDTAGNELPTTTSDFSVIDDPLTISAFVPAQGAVNVPVDTLIAVEFVRAPDPASLIPSTMTDLGSIRLVRETNSEEIFGCIEIDPDEPRRVLFRPIGTATTDLQVLAPASFHRFLIGVDVTDFAGNSMLEEESALWMTQ